MNIEIKIHTLNLTRAHQRQSGNERVPRQNFGCGTKTRNDSSQFALSGNNVNNLMDEHIIVVCVCLLKRIYRITIGLRAGSPFTPQPLSWRSGSFVYFGNRQE